MSELAIRKKGTIVNFDAARGFGFIEVPGQWDRIFVHHRDLRAAGLNVPRVGTWLEFDETKGNRGLIASNLRAA
jgi:cold shock CspA family protein